MKLFPKDNNNIRKIIIFWITSKRKIPFEGWIIYVLVFSSNPILILNHKFPIWRTFNVQILLSKLVCLCILFIYFVSGVKQKKIIVCICKQRMVLVLIRLTTMHNTFECEQHRYSKRLILTVVAADFLTLSSQWFQVCADNCLDEHKELFEYRKLKHLRETPEWEKTNEV